MKLSNKKNYDVSGAVEILQPQCGAVYWLDDNEIRGADLTFTEEELDQAGGIVKLNEIKITYQQEAQRHLDEKAKESGYDSIFTAVTYAEEPSVPAFQAEAQALRAWRSAVWAYAYQVLSDVEAGDIDLPTLEDFIGGMPAYVSPA